MFLTNEVETAFMNQQIALESRLIVKGGHAGFEAAVGGLDVAVAVVNANDDGMVIVNLLL